MGSNPNLKNHSDALKGFASLNFFDFVNRGFCLIHFYGMALVTWGKCFEVTTKFLLIFWSKRPTYSSMTLLYIGLRKFPRMHILGPGSGLMDLNPNFLSNSDGCEHLNYSCTDFALL